MPVIAEFDGIRVEIYYADHPPPHFHVRYAGVIAQMGIASLDVLAGSLPVPILRKVRRWARANQAALALNWSKAQSAQPLDTL